MKSNLDERQELKLLKIQHYGCWLAFWGLLADILIQMILGNMVFKNFIGEVIVFMSLVIYLVVASLKEGIWDRKYKPNLKTNLLFSTIGALVEGIVFFFISYRDYQNLKGSIGIMILIFFMMEIVCMILFTVAGKIYKKRVHQLEDSNEE